MSIVKEFRDFIAKGNVIDLAVAVVIGGAFGKVVSAVVDDLVMPLVGALLPSGDWREFTVSPLHFKVGHFLGAIIDFLIIAFVIFVVVVKTLGTIKKQVAAPAPAPPPTKQCPECLEAVPVAARRCRACTAALA
jgi:large conductance mechanosensitive channel